MPYPYETKAIPFDGWLNTAVYDTTDLILFGGGCWLWVIAYAILIHNIVKYKKVEMPTIVASGNFAWEGFWSFIGKNNFGWAALWAYKAWFFLDIFIWYSVLRYGMADTTHPMLRNNFKTYFVLSTLAYFGFYWVLWQMDLDTGIGAHSAYLLNTLISMTYVLNYARLRQTDMVYSIWIAWLKMIGTGMNTVFMLKNYPEDVFLMYLGGLIFVFDLWYAIWMTRDRITGAVPHPKLRLQGSAK